MFLDIRAGILVSLLALLGACAGAPPEVQAQRAAAFAAVNGSVRQSVNAAAQCSPSDHNSRSGSYAVGNVVQEAGNNTSVDLFGQHTCESRRGNLRPEYYYYSYPYSYPRYWGHGHQGRHWR